MLPAVLAVIAALAFVLGLGAICLWALKRWGAVSLGSRSRIAVEVVQRISLGPKTGLAVVRVGEKVMAVSVGEGGLRPLFELDEADRQRVVASSDVPTPMISSPQASAAFAKFLPGAFGRAMSTSMTQVMAREASAQPTAVAAMSSPSGAAHHTMVFRTDEAREIPSFLTAAPSMHGVPSSYRAQADVTSRFAPPASHAVASIHDEPLTVTPLAPLTRVSVAPDSDFRAMLRGALSGSTRLAVFTGAMIVASSVVSPLSAQAAPPTAPPTTSTQAGTTTTGSPVVTPSAAVPPTVTPAAAATAPQTLPLPELPASAGANTAARPLPAALQPPVAPRAPLVPPAGRGTRGSSSTAAAATPRTGNGASVTPGGAAARRPMSQMQVDSAANATTNPRAAAAQPAPIAADEAVMRMLPQMDVQLGDAKEGGLRLNGTVGIVVMMGLLTLLPTLLLMMTGFTRILIVLHFLKQAMGTQSAPPAQLLAAMALLLTGFVMAPTLTQVNNQAITPWLDGKITQVEMMKTSVVPMREFMLKQTRESDLKTFVEMSKLPRPNSADDVPLHVLMSAFVASELRTAFQIGFAIYLPFIIIDAVVASVLMSMGMFMLPPAMISLPFKLLLFVLVDGWSLTITSLVQSFK